MNPQDLIEAVKTLAGGVEELHSRLVDSVPRLDAAGQDAVWDAMKKKSDELYRTNLSAAQAVAGWMVDLSSLTGNPVHRALGLLAKGNVYALAMGEHRQAVDFYTEAISIYKAQGRPVQAAQTTIGMIFALSNLGHYTEALQFGEWARQVLAESGEKVLEVRAVTNLAILRGRLGQDAEALALLDEAKTIYEEIGPTLEESLLRVELNRALVLRNLGRFPEAISASERVYAAHLQAGRMILAARAQQSLAMTYYLQGRYNEALTLFEAVREAFTADDRQRNAVLVELFVSDCLLHLRRFPDALEKCAQVRQLFSKLGGSFEVGQAILNEAAAYEGLRRFGEAQSSVAEARRLFEQEGNRSSTAEADLFMARLLLEQGQAQASLELSETCDAVFAEQGRSVHRARAGLVRVRALLALGQVETAERAVRMVLESGERLFMPDLTFASRHLLGQISLQQGQSAASLAAFDQAISDLEQMCGRMMVEFRAGFIEDKGAIYEDAVDLCLNLNLPERGLDFCERSKSRALLDMLSHRVDVSITARSAADRPLVAELEHLRAERDRLYRRRTGGEGFGLRGDDGALMDSCAEAEQVLKLEKQITELWHRLLVRSADYAREAALWQVRTEPVQPFLRPGSLLVEYYVIHGQLVAFLVDDKNIEVVRLPGTMTEVQRRTQIFWLNMRTAATSLNSPRTTPQQREGLAVNMQGLLKKFYDLLIAPFTERLEKVERLVIVPHGALHYLPFHALFDGQAYLLERYEVSILPGASLLRYCRESAQNARKTADSEGKNVHLLSVANSYGGKLPNVLTEAEQVAAMWQGEALVEEQATLAAVRAMAPGRKILHLATHGDFRPDNPLFSGLALADGWLTTLDVFNLRLDASLITLSACQTGRSVIGGGDELLGLMRSFLAAGAASLVSTLWAVEDQSTADLMTCFYAALANGAEKGAALRQAQLTMLNQKWNGGPDRSHPYFWAPFYLVGDDGVL